MQVIGSAFPLRRWTYPRPCGLPQTPVPITAQTTSTTPLLRFRLPPEFCPVDPSRSSAPAPLMGFASLQHMPDPRVHFTRACHTRFAPPSGFGYPPDGFRPSNPGRPCFVPAALMGFVTPFEASSTRKVPEAFTPPGEPACRWLTVSSHAAEATRTGATSLDFQVLTLPSVPRPATRQLAKRQTGCSLGLHPF
jgi:hypothetical protein